MQASPTPVRSLFDQGVRSDTTNPIKASLRSGMKQRPTLTRQDDLGEVMDTNTPASPASTGSPAKPSILRKAPPTAARAGMPAPGTQQRETASPLTGDPASVPTGGTQDLGTVKPKPLSVVQRGGGALPGDATNSPQAWRGGQQPGQGGPTDLGNGVVLNAPKPNAAKALGFSQKGTGVPRGDDALPAAGNEPTVDNGTSPGGNAGTFPGGTGPLQRNFSNPTSASVYHDYTKNLFAGANTAPAARAGKSLLTRAPATRAGAEDRQTEEAADSE